jgi:hypothetical protein
MIVAMKMFKITSVKIMKNP